MKTIGFIGLGLIGGSIARTIRKFHPDYRLLAFDKDRDALAEAVSLNVIDGICDIEDERLYNCDYLFLCAPVEFNVKNIGAGDQAVIYNVNGITVILGTCEHVKNIVGFSVINGTADLDQHTDKFVQNCGNVFLVFQADLLPHNW